MRLSDCDCGAAWRGFFRDHCDALFQMALLLSADPDTAEAILATALEDIDTSVPPKADDLGILQKTIVIKIVHDAGSVSAASVSNAGSMLQRGLRPILQLERFPRVCFVLRFLLGYGTSSCAQMMGVEEAGVKALLHLGLIQFHRAVMGENPERLEGCVAAGGGRRLEARTNDRQQKAS